MFPNHNHEPHVHLNLNVRGLKPSATIAINDLSNRLIAQGREIFKLGLGQSPFPVPEPVVDALREHAGCKEYLPTVGLRELRSAVANYHGRTSGISCSANDILIGPGSKELMFLLQIVYYGDLVVPTPAWVSYAPQARIVGRPVSFLHAKRENSWRLTPDQLHDLCVDDPDRPRIVVLNYPSNPTGITYETEELREIARVARKFRVILLSDEIYGELHHKGRHVSVARFYKEGTIISSGLSKWCGAGGWRLGTFRFPPEVRWLRDAMAAVASETYTSTCAPVQHAAIRAFVGGFEVTRYLKDARRILSALGSESTRLLREAGVDLDQPDGGFYLFPNFSPHRETLRSRGIETSAQLCMRLLDEAGVAMLPGSEFGRSEGELTARISYVNFDGARALKAAREMPSDASLGLRFLDECCGETLEAIRRVGEWVRRGEIVRSIYSAPKMPEKEPAPQSNWGEIRRLWGEVFGPRRSAK